MQHDRLYVARTAFFLTNQKFYIITSKKSDFGNSKYQQRRLYYLYPGRKILKIRNLRDLFLPQYCCLRFQFFFSYSQVFILGLFRPFNFQNTDFSLFSLLDPDFKWLGSRISFCGNLAKNWLINFQWYVENRSPVSCWFIWIILKHEYFLRKILFSR